MNRKRITIFRHSQIMETLFFTFICGNEVFRLWLHVSCLYMYLWITTFFPLSFLDRRNVHSHCVWIYLFPSVWSRHSTWCVQFPGLLHRHFSPSNILFKELLIQFSLFDFLLCRGIYVFWSIENWFLTNWNKFEKWGLNRSRDLVQKEKNQFRLKFYESNWKWTEHGGI